MIRIGISSPPYLFCVVWSIICPDDIESKFANFVTKFSFRTFFHFNLLNQCLSICISRYNNVSREYFKCHRCENFTVYKNILIFINTLFIVSTIFSTNLDLIKKNKIKSSKNIYTNWKTKTKILFHSKYYNIFSRNLKLIFPLSVQIFIYHLSHDIVNIWFDFYMIYNGQKLNASLFIIPKAWRRIKN